MGSAQSLLPHVWVQEHASDGRTTIVSVIVRLSNDLGDNGNPTLFIKAYTGVAQRLETDSHDEEAAYGLALGRALKSAGASLERRGFGLVKHQDDVREARTKASQMVHNHVHAAPGGTHTGMTAAEHNAAHRRARKTLRRREARKAQAKQASDA